MSNLSKYYTVYRPNPKCYYSRYTVPSLKFLNGGKNQSVVDIVKEDSAISLKSSYLALNFIVILRARCNRCADSDQLRLVNLCTIA